MTRPPLFIVNPRSAAGSTGRAWAQVEGYARAQLGDMVVATTEKPLHAVEIARRAALSGEFRAVVSVGGDGTNIEVVNGLMRAKAERPELDLPGFGFVPAGTGGDFRKTFGYPAHPAAAIDRLANPTPRRIDVGRLCFTPEQPPPFPSPDGASEQADSSTATNPSNINRPPIALPGVELPAGALADWPKGIVPPTRQAWFLNILSFGVSGTTCHYVNTGPKWLGGRLAFLIATLRAMMAYRDAPVVIEADGEIVHRGWLRLGVAANGQVFGGGMRIAPSADPSDGQLNGVALGPASILDFVMNINMLYSGRGKDPAFVRRFPLTRLRAYIDPEASPPPSAQVLLEADGENWGGLPLAVDVVPGALILLN